MTLAEELRAAVDAVAEAHSAFSSRAEYEQSRADIWDRVDDGIGPELDAVEAAREKLDTALARVAELEAERDEAQRDASECERARRCVVCDGLVCPPITCTGCALHRGDAVAITDHAMRLERDQALARVAELEEQAREYPVGTEPPEWRDGRIVLAWIGELRHLPISDVWVGGWTPAIWLGEWPAWCRWLRAMPPAPAEPAGLEP